MLSTGAAVHTPAVLWDLPWEDLLAVYLAVEDARRCGRFPLYVPTAAGLARAWSALAQLCLLRGDFCAFAHLVAALLPGGIASRRVVFCDVVRGGEGTTVVFGP